MSVSLSGLKLANPVLAASGTFGAGREASAFVDVSALGGVIVKSMTLVPWKGKPTPRMCETPSGMLNAIGIQNKGVDHFIAEDLRWLKTKGATVIASVAGNTVEEFAGVTRKLRAKESDIAAIEANISCPNLEDRSNMFSHSTDATGDVVHAVKDAAGSIPVFPKLSPNVTSLTAIARAALDAGADGLSLVNTVLGMAIDVQRRRPKLAGVVGGLSGPAIRPVAVRAVHEVHRAWPHVPIIGQGGVASTGDALEMIMAGASAVAVGTAHLVDPRAGVEIASGIADFLDSEGIHDISELIGCVKLE
jgi:dihydroorotate dehydrogenase (NAD+) catalytic subunit